MQGARAGRPPRPTTLEVQRQARPERLGRGNPARHDVLIPGNALRGRRAGHSPLGRAGQPGTDRRNPAAGRPPQPWPQPAGKVKFEAVAVKQAGIGVGVGIYPGRCAEARRHGIAGWHAGGVILLDQRDRVGSDYLRDRADMTARIEVPAARRVIVAFDISDDRFPDAGALAHLSDGQSGFTARLCQRPADVHVSPPCGVV